MTQEINLAASAIAGGDTYLGIEFGSTRIKAVLIDKNHEVLASGGHNWENRLEGGFWTYSMEDVFAGLQDAFAKLQYDNLVKMSLHALQLQNADFQTLLPDLTSSNHVQV